jgi:hypothetical protein
MMPPIRSWHSGAACHSRRSIGICGPPRQALNIELLDA